jgi:hypothetical protein
MPAPRDGSAPMVRIIVKLRPEQYDDLFRYVREIGSTMSAFCRESTVKAMRDDCDRLRQPSSLPSGGIQKSTMS